MIISNEYVSAIEISRQHAKHHSSKHLQARKAKISRAQQRQQLLIKFGEMVLNQRYSSVSKELGAEIKELFELYTVKDFQLTFDAKQKEEILKKPQNETSPLHPKFNNIDTLINAKIDAIKNLYKTELATLQKDNTDGKVSADAQKRIEQIAKEQDQLANIESCKQEIFAEQEKINELKALSQDDEVKLKDNEKEAAQHELDGLVRRLGNSTIDCSKKVSSYLLDLNVNLEKLKQRSLKASARELVIKALEENLPPKFCWKIVTPLKECKDPNFEMKFFKCRKRCQPGQTRFGVWCVENCLDSEVQAKTCEIRRIGLKIARKTVEKGKEVWNSKYRDWTRSDSNKDYNYSCPEPYKAEVVKSGLIFKSDKTICVSNPQVECENIGMRTCGSKRACALNTKQCVLTILSIIADVSTGLLKFASMFVAPGAANAIEWALSSVSWATQLQSIVSQIDDSFNFFKEIHENKVQRQILIQKVFNQVKDNQIFKDLAALPSTKVQPVKGKARMNKKQQKSRLIKKAQQKVTENQILLFINFLEEQQYQEFINRSVLKKLVNKETLKETVFQALSAYTVVQDLTLKSDIQNWLGNESDQLYAMFQWDTYKSLADTVQSTKESTATKLKTVLGLASQFDPSGVTNILKAFIFDRCPTEGYFSKEQIALIKADKSWKS